MTGEAELVRSLRAGSREAFREFVQVHQEHVFALALRLTGDEHDAMDLTQETFIKAWLAVSRFRGESRLSTWVHGIVVRLARQQWRTRKRRDARERRWARERYQDALREAMPEASIDLECAIAELSPRMRMALVLHCIEGLPQKEVARLMGVAEGTVKAHIHSARRALQEKLGP
jgi:RNA polymerase sigma-70 factor (ECF subfamily)